MERADFKLEEVTSRIGPASYIEVYRSTNEDAELLYKGIRVKAHDEIEGFEQVYGAIAGAARVLTHVNASSLFQRVVAKCVDVPSDIAAYEENGNLLYNGLIEAGFTCQKPQGAFYLFPKALEDDDYAFCERAKKYDLLLVPGTDFGCPGYFRAAYCIKKSTIEASLPAFRKLAEEYRK